MDIVEALSSISKNLYPSIAVLIAWITVIVGVIFNIAALSMWFRVRVTYTLDASSFRPVQLLLLLFFGALCLSLSWTMSFSAETIYGQGSYVLDAYENTEEWYVRQDRDATSALKEFAIMTCRIIGLFFISFGVITGGRAQYPNNQGGNNPPTMKAALVRIAVGAVLLHPVGFLDTFGDWGTRYLQP